MTKQKEKKVHMYSFWIHNEDEDVTEIWWHYIGSDPVRASSRKWRSLEKKYGVMVSQSPHGCLTLEQIEKFHQQLSA